MGRFTFFVTVVLFLGLGIAACREKNENAIIEGKEMAPNSVTQPVPDTNAAPGGSDTAVTNSPVEGPVEAPGK